MELLSGNSLASAFASCDKNPGLEIGIACINRRSMQELTRALINHIQSDMLFGWRLSTVHFANKTILEKYGNGFTDRSRITIFAANMVNPHGMSFHNIIYEDSINESVLQDLSMLERLSYQEKDVNDVLDEFLNSFKVVSNRNFIIEGGT